MTAHRLLILVFGLPLVSIAAGCASDGPRTAAADAGGEPGYVTSVGAAPDYVRDGSGRCVRTGSWRPDHANRACEPEMFARLDAQKAQTEAERAREEAERRAQAEAEAAERARLEAEERERAMAAAAAAAQPVWRTVGADAYFATNAAELDDRSKRALDTLVERARGAEEVRVTVIGHADSTGNPKYNQALSQRRAEAVRSYLIEQGLPGESIAVTARGANEPVIDCAGRDRAAREQCLQVNRRSQVLLSVLVPAGQ